jgi:CRP-like cAMP-binding protein
VTARDPMRLFGSVRSTDVRSLAGPVVDVQVSAGAVLARQGAEVGTFCVIRSGAAVLTRDGQPVGTLGAGDCFGEINPDAAVPQRYGVVATSPVRLVTFSAFGISRLCEAIPGTRKRILEALADHGAEVRPLRPVGSGPALRVVAGG